MSKNSPLLSRIVYLPPILLILAIGAYWLIQIVQTETEYAPGYSKEGFRTIEVGDNFSKVIDVLGEPLEEIPGKPRRLFFWYDEQRVNFVWDDSGNLLNRERLLSKFDRKVLEKISTHDDMVAELGPYAGSSIEGELGDEEKKRLIYGRYNGEDISWMVREVEIDTTTGMVVRKIAYWYRGD